jgi:hypothetical protein
MASTAPRASRAQSDPLLAVTSDLVGLLLRLREELRLVSTPIDFVGLERRGILVRDVGGWWRVPDLGALPGEAAHKIIKLECDSNGVRVRFSPPRLKAEARDGAVGDRAVARRATAPRRVRLGAE